MKLKLGALCAGNTLEDSIIQNVLVESALKEIKDLFKKAGFTVSQSKSSALFDLSATKNGVNYSVSGWHGTGGYGKSKALLELYKGSTRLVQTNPDSDLQTHKDNVEKMLEILRKEVK